MSERDATPRKRAAADKPAPPARKASPAGGPSSPPRRRRAKAAVITPAIDSHSHGDIPALPRTASCTDPPALTGTASAPEPTPICNSSAATTLAAPSPDPACSTVTGVDLLSIIPLTLTPQQEAFARGIAEGLSAAESYRRHMVTGSISTREAAEQGRRLLRLVRPRVDALLRRARDIAEEEFGFGRRAVIAYLLEVLETPAAEVDEHHRLAEELRITTQGRQVKFFGKVEAMKLLTSITGLNAPEKQAPTSEATATLSEVLRDVRMRRQQAAEGQRSNQLNGQRSTVNGAGG